LTRLIKMQYQMLNKYVSGLWLRVTSQ